MKETPVVWRTNSNTVAFIYSIRVTDRNDTSNEDPCLHFEAKLVPDLHLSLSRTVQGSENMTNISYHLVLQIIYLIKC